MAATFHARLAANSEDFHTGAIDYETFDLRARAIWREIQSTPGADEAVLSMIRAGHVWTRIKRPEVYRCDEGHGFHASQDEADDCDDYNRNSDHWDREELRGL